tara:strand:+ start:8326 stop:8637 length:312 start_codon:yes stop_codon:yes gene_type:complete
MKKKICGYKIRNKDTGKYLTATGGWTSMGKVYIKKGSALKKLNVLLSRAPESFEKYENGLKGLLYSGTKTKEDLLDEILRCEIVELCEANSYPIVFELDKLKV